MLIIQKETEQANDRKRTDQFCGRLIFWDVDTPQDDIVILAADYCYAKPDLSTQNEPKPYAPPVRLPGTASSAPSSLKPIAQRFYLRYGFLPPDFSKKPLLN